jgi:hypothetical protein
MNKSDKKPERASATEDAPRERTLADKLKAGELDLTIEEVEERIAPSETNVFDK